MTDHKPEPAGGADPSMEDILASIRRILSEDEPAADKSPEPAAEADDVLMLDSSMIVPAAPPAPPPPTSHAAAEPAAEPEPAPAPAPVQTPLPLPPAAVPHAGPALEPAPPLPAPVPPDLAALVAPEAAAAAASSVGALVRTLAAGRATQTHRGGPTIEDIVREEMRPLLKHWLDTNLPGLVERLVKTEIERVVSRDVG